MSKEKVILCFSGGLDSTVLLWSLKKQYEVRCISIDYGQRHRVELEKANKIAKVAEVEHKIIDLSCLKEILGGSSQTSDTVAVPEGHYADESMKLTVVPNRNMILLSLATAWAISTKSQFVTYAAHAGDHCLPADIPISTKRGLVEISKIKLGDEVLSFNQEIKHICWKKVLQISKKGIPSKLLKIVTKSGATIRCTEEHKLYVIERSNFTRRLGWEKNLIKKKASEITPEDYLINPGQVVDNGNERDENENIDLLTLIMPLIKDSKYLFYNNENIWFKKTNKVKRLVKLSAVMKLIAWYVTEGCGTSIECYGLKANQYGISISQSSTADPGKLSEIIEVAKEWGFNPSVYGKDTNTSVSFSGPTSILLTNCGRKSRDKSIPNWMLSYPNYLLKQLFETMIAGDGHTKSENHLQYVTTSKTLIRQMAYIGCRLGFKSSVGKMITNDAYSVNFYRSQEKSNLNRYGGTAFSKVKSIEVIGNTLPVYDIGVEDTHNFFTGDTIPTLVSNSIYPDCRQEFTDSLDKSISLCDWNPPRLLRPFVQLTKTDIVKLGYILQVPMELAYSCYKGREKHCGKCGTCIERLEAYQLSGVKDPTEYE